MGYNPLGTATKAFRNDIPAILPHAKLYSIQVGGKLFKVSGASLSSDAPSYFTKFFQDPQNENKTLFVDRSPVIFQYIYEHLQGYVLDITYDLTFSQLLVDVEFFSLPRLERLLQQEYGIFARIGNQSFCIPTALFQNPGNSPNFFTINHVETVNAYTRINKIKLHRPPPTRPLWVAHKLPQLFSDILELLRGNMSVVRDDTHRQALINDCRYYLFLEVEQRLLKHKILYNPFLHTSEIIMNLNDISQRGLWVPLNASGQITVIQYQRLYIEHEPKRDLIFQTDCSREKYDIKLILNKSLKFISTKFSGVVFYKLYNLLKHVIATRDFINADHLGDESEMFLITSLDQCHCVINGMTMKPTWINDMLQVADSDINAGVLDLENAILNDKSKYSQTAHRYQPNIDHNNNINIKGDVFEFRISKIQWKISILDGHPKLQGVRIEANSDMLGFIRDQVEFI